MAMPELQAVLTIVVEDEISFLDELATFLNTADIQQLLITHPNKTTLPDFECPDCWRFWWEWASDVDVGAVDASEAKWVHLWHYYTCPSESTRSYDSIPDDLRSFIDRCRTLQLDREPGRFACPLSSSSRSTREVDIPLPSAGELRADPRLRGMSPKKAHEVSRMTEYTSRFLSYVSRQDTAIRHVVDIGAGQVSHFS